MVLMEWTDQLSVGIAVIDQQHMLLIDLINQMDEAVRESVRNPAIPGILTSLVELSTKHCTEEEKLMRETGFAGLEEHHTAHEKLLRAVVDVREKVNSGRMSASASLPGFLHFWLEKHIAGYDQQYARHIASLKTAGTMK